MNEAFPDSNLNETLSAQGDPQELSEPLPPPGDDTDRYGPAVTRISKSDDAIRAALTHELTDRTAKSFLLRDAAEEAFSILTPGRYTPVDRERSTHLAPFKVAVPQLSGDGVVPALNVSRSAGAT